MIVATFIDRVIYCKAVRLAQTISITYGPQCKTLKLKEKILHCKVFFNKVSNENLLEVPAQPVPAQEAQPNRSIPRGEDHLTSS